MSEETVRESALVLVAHGGQDVDDGGAWLGAHVHALARGGRFACVTGCFLRGEPSLVRALAEVAASSARRLLVFPLLMSAGYLVRNLLPARVADAEPSTPVRILRPLGLDPRLPSVLLRRALAVVESRGYEPGSTRLLLVGHGSSRGPESAAATRRVADALRSAGQFGSVETAFLEEAPRIDDALRHRRVPTVVSGFFCGGGRHATRDVPQAIAAAGGEVLYAGPVGIDLGIPDLVVAAVLEQILNDR